MDLKLSISILVSSAYFLTLFLFKLFKSPDILGNLTHSATYAFGVFILIYALITYISIAFDNSKRKEANDAIERIRKLEEEHLAKKAEAIKNKFSEIDKAILDKEKLANSYKGEDKEDEDIDKSSEVKDVKNTFTEEQDIEELKKQSGTQFDSNFTTEDIQI